MHAIFGIVAGVVVLFVVAKGFFGSLWREPPKREESPATDWSSGWTSYGGGNQSYGPSDPEGSA